MDVIFDIDGTLADAGHRMPYITNPEEPKNWDMFFEPGNIAADAPIPEMWKVLTGLVTTHATVIFSTGRPERIRNVTYDWLTEIDCEHRALTSRYWDNCPSSRKPILLMRKDGDRRPSAEVKRDHLEHIRSWGKNPTLVFEDRKADADMWRQEGLICCQVAEGDF